MTSSNKPQRLLIPQPFASGVGAALKPIEIDDTNNNPNFKTGFPDVYSAANGKYVMRSEINAIGNLASANEFYRACGGIHTFDPELATAIGGYPQGAILAYSYDRKLFFVISLVDNNMVNFIENGIDDTNWAICNTPEGEDDNVVMTITGDYSGTTEFLHNEPGTSDPNLGFVTPNFINTIKAQRSGSLTISGTFKAHTETFQSQAGVSFTTSAGGLIVCKEFDSLEDAAGWDLKEVKGTPVYSLGFATIPRMDSASVQYGYVIPVDRYAIANNAALFEYDVWYDPGFTQQIAVTSGKYYALYMLVRNAYPGTAMAITEANLKVKII